MIYFIKHVQRDDHLTSVVDDEECFELERFLVSHGKLNGRNRNEIGCQYYDGQFGIAHAKPIFHALICLFVCLF